MDRIDQQPQQPTLAYARVTEAAARAGALRDRVTTPATRPVSAASPARRTLGHGGGTR